MKRAASEYVLSLAVLSRSPEETGRLGLLLAAELPIPGVVLLHGPLGVGKTILTKGIAAGLGLADPTVVTSPSYTLVNMYQARCMIYHVDLYRIAGLRDLETTGIDEFLGQKGVTIVEWSERLPIGVRGDLIVEMADAGGEIRQIRVWKAVGPRPRTVLQSKKLSTGRDKRKAQVMHGRGKR